MVAFLFVSKIPVFWDFLFAQNAENKRWFVFGIYFIFYDIKRTVFRQCYFIRTKEK